jgi:hypothetical protein
MQLWDAWILIPGITRWDQSKDCLDINITLNHNNPEVPEQHEDGREVWVKGAPVDDIQRYKEFLSYMEERRKEARERLMEEKERKGTARKKEKAWS